MTSLDMISIYLTFYILSVNVMDHSGYEFLDKTMIDFHARLMNSPTNYNTKNTLHWDIFVGL